ncbi:MAG: hypothetical protein GY835_11275 [bacterium]|nr:hypothetical protein [bacterium]
MHVSKTAVVFVDEWAGSGDIPLCVNGKPKNVKTGEFVELSAEFLEALEASHVEFRSFNTMEAAMACAAKERKAGDAGVAQEQAVQDNAKEEKRTAAIDDANMPTPKPKTKTKPKIKTAPPADLSILDGNIKAVVEAISGLSREHLQELLAAEESGKTRKGVVAAINKALAA